MASLNLEVAMKSYVLSLSVLLTIVSVIALAADPEDENPPSEPLAKAEDAVEESPSGGFIFSLPLVVPVGRGPVPNLSLRYSSESGNGLAGVGWGLEGLPVIGRIAGDVGMNFTAS